MAIYVKRVKGIECHNCIFEVPKECPLSRNSSVSRLGGDKYWCTDNQTHIAYHFRNATPEEIKRHLEKSEA